MANLPSKIANTIENGYEFRFGDYISRGFEYINRNLGLFIGFVFVYMAISLVLAFIPIIGTIASLVISPALTIGFAIATHKSANQETLQFSDFFKGFDKLGNLFLVSLLTGLLILAVMIPGFIIIATSVGMQDIVYGDTEAFSNPLLWIGLLLIFLPLVYLAISYAYSAMLVWFYNMEAWQAMEASRKIISKTWGTHFLFFFVIGLIGVAGILLLGIGLLYTVPAVQAIIYAAFSDITGLNESDEEASADLIDHFVPSGQ